MKVRNLLASANEIVQGTRQRYTVSTCTTKTDALLAQVDDLDLSELCRTINEPSDIGNENIDETVSANSK
jgi:hypothetical protein